jgi:hypothetical protein
VGGTGLTFVLKAAGCEKLFAEQLSSISGKRAQLEAANDYLRDVFRSLGNPKNMLLAHEVQSYRRMTEYLAAAE